MKLIWNERPRRDIIETAGYIAGDNPTAARKWVERIRRQAKQALQLPKSGRIVPERPRDDLREFLDGNYRIVYKIHDDAVEIMTVFERHRQTPIIEE